MGSKHQLNSSDKPWAAGDDAELPPSLEQRRPAADATEADDVAGRAGDRGVQALPRSSGYHAESGCSMEAAPIYDRGADGSGSFRVFNETTTSHGGGNAATATLSDSARCSTASRSAMKSRGRALAAAAATGQFIWSGKRCKRREAGCRREMALQRKSVGTRCRLPGELGHGRSCSVRIKSRTHGSMIRTTIS